MQDHPYNDGFLDTFTLLTWLASKGQSRPFRHQRGQPAVAAADDARQAGGHHRRPLRRPLRAWPRRGRVLRRDRRDGRPPPRAGQARGALSEAIDIIRASWAGEPFSYQGSYYQAPGVRPGPRPAHDIGLWLGVVGPRAAQLVGAKADGWSVSAPYVPPDRLTELNQIITSAARNAGRDPAAITRLYNVMGLITPQDRDTFNGPVER